MTLHKSLNAIRRIHMLKRTRSAPHVSNHQVQYRQVTRICSVTGAPHYPIFGLSLTLNTFSISHSHPPPETVKCLCICVFLPPNLQWIKNEILAAKVHKLLPIVGFLLILVILFWQLGSEETRGVGVLEISLFVPVRPPVIDVTVQMQFMQILNADVTAMHWGPLF